MHSYCTVNGPQKQAGSHGERIKMSGAARFFLARQGLGAYTVGMDIQKLVQNLLEEGVRGGCFPAVTAAVGRGEETICLCSAGDANLDTRFDMASMSKILGPTMLALRALEEGALTLSDTIGQYFADVPQDKRDITVRHLMTHTGGFTPHFLLEEEADGPADALAAILRHPLDAAPGEKPMYSCMGYIVLGKLLEALYGAPLDALARERVFSPLGMLHTGYCPTGGNIAPTEVNPKTALPGRASCMTRTRASWAACPPTPAFSPTYATARATPPCSACGGKGYLAPATLRAAIRNYTPGHDAHRGLGFHVAGLPGEFFGDLFPAPSFGHTGFTGTSLVVDPESGVFAVLLSNRVHPSRENARHLRFRRRFHNAVYAALSRDARG